MCVVCGGKKSSRLLVLKLFGFFGPLSFFFFFVSLSRVLGPFFSLFCLNPKPRRILEKEEEEGDDEDEE